MSASCFPHLSKGTSGLGSCVGLPPRGPSPTDTIIPRSGFVYKFKGKGGGKVFVNVVMHHVVKKPLDSAWREVSIEHLDSRGVGGLRVPFTVGEAFLVQDNAGADAFAVDIILHPAVVARAREGKMAAHFQSELAGLFINCLQELFVASGNFNEDLDPKGWKVLKGRYKGGTGPKPIPMWRMGSSLGTVSHQGVKHNSRGAEWADNDASGAYTAEFRSSRDTDSEPLVVRALEDHWMALADSMAVPSVAGCSSLPSPITLPQSHARDENETRLLEALRQMNVSQCSVQDAEQFEQALLQRGSSLRPERGAELPREELAAEAFSRSAGARLNVWMRLPGNGQDVHVNLSRAGSVGSGRSGGSLSRSGSGSRGSWAGLLKEVAQKMEDEEHQSSPSSMGSSSKLSAGRPELEEQARGGAVWCQKMELRSDLVATEEWDSQPSSPSMVRENSDSQLCPRTCSAVVVPTVPTVNQTAPRRSSLWLVDEATGEEKSWYPVAQARMMTMIDYMATVEERFNRHNHQHSASAGALRPVEERSDEGHSVQLSSWDELEADHWGGLTFSDTHSSSGQTVRSSVSSVSLCPSDSVSVTRRRSRPFEFVQKTHGSTTPRTVDDPELDGAELLDSDDEVEVRAEDDSAASAQTTRTAELGYWQGEYVLGSRDFVRLQKDKPHSMV